MNALHAIGNPMVEPATVDDLGAIANLNVEAYREFARVMTPEGWRGMEANLRAIDVGAQTAQFLVVRVSGALVGSIAYCPAGKGNPAIFPATWASILLLAVAPMHRGRGIARDLARACVRRARVVHEGERACPKPSCYSHEGSTASSPSRPA